MERIVSSATRDRRADVVGLKRPKKPLHSRGASSMVKNVNTAIVVMETSVEKAAAPTERAVAGLRTLVICEAIFEELSERYFCRWRRYTRWPNQPWPFLACLTRVGSWSAKCVTPVTSGETNR